MTTILQARHARQQKEAEAASKRYVKAQQDGNTLAAWTALHDWAKADGSSIMLEAFTYTLPKGNL